MEFIVREFMEFIEREASYLLSFISGYLIFILLPVTATCSSHQVFASSFVTKDFFIGDCISAAYKNCDLEKCFMLCCKHNCRSFGHSPTMLCVLNTCIVPEKTKKKESSVGNTFQYLW